MARGVTAIAALNGVDPQADSFGIGSYLVVGALVAVLWYAANSVWLVEAFDKRDTLVFHSTFVDKDDAEDAVSGLKRDGYRVRLRTFKGVFNP